MSKFKTIRETLGVSQDEMAEALDCSQGNVSLLDRGQTVMPETAQKLIDFAKKKGFRIGFDHVYGKERLPKVVKKAAANRSERPTARRSADRSAR